MRSYLILIFAALIGSACERKPDTPQAASDTAQTIEPDERVWRAKWNMGDDPDEPDRSVSTRFVVRVEQFRSGILTVRLDTAAVGSSGDNRHFFTADSVRVSGLAPADRFTQGCKYGSGPWMPRIGIVSDTVYERSSRPKFIWLLDTMRVRIRELPTDSASCFLRGPD